ncbi:MAG: transcription antitermination factor NusB [Pseudomonadota bacterium]
MPPRKTFGDRKRDLTGSKRRGAERPEGRGPQRPQRGERPPLQRDTRRPRRESDEAEPAKVELPPGVAARDASLTLLQLTAQGLPLDQALEQAHNFNALEGSDRSFARAIASTTLRRRGALDEIIASFLRTPLKPKQRRLQDIFRITAAQLCLMGTEAHAAVWAATELTKLREETKGYGKLVNAVSRKIAEGGKAKLDGLPLRIDTPGWLWRRLSRDYGSKTAGLLAEAHRREPPLDLCVKDPSAPLPEGFDALNTERFGRRTVRMPSARVPDLPGFDEGAFWVQDLAASLPAELLGAKTGEVVYDLCAAPGGKTMQLAAAGAKVTAVDASETRLGKLEENLERTGLSAEIVVADVLHWEPNALADKVLLDAPCSATGTIRRNPDLLWTARDSDIEALVRLQTRMLDRAIALTKPGGTIVYAVCSLLKDEGEEQISRLLKEHDDIRRVPISAEDVADLPVINKDGDLRCLPHRLTDKGGMDGFFACRLKKL